MKIRFAKDFISFSFDDGEIFSGRVLDSDGEATSNTFYADATTLKWRPPHSEEKLSAEDIKVIWHIVESRNNEHDYKIKFYNEKRNSHV